MPRAIGIPLLIVGGLVALLLGPSAVADPQGAEQVVEKMERRFETISGYRCELHTISILKDLREERAFSYIFERPRSIRMRVLDGKDRGSVLIYKDGVVRGHRGGLFSWVVLTFRPSDSEVTTIRGGRVDQSDFLFIMDVLRSAVKEGKLRLEGTDFLMGNEHYRLALLHHVDPLEDGAVAGTFWVDSKNLVVSQYELYGKDSKLIYKQSHDQLELSAPLPIGPQNLEGMVR